MGAHYCAVCEKYIPGGQGVTDKDGRDLCYIHGENYVENIEAENARLADLLRWRKYPEEKPEENEEYWCLCDDPLLDNGKLYPEVREGWEILDLTGRAIYFRPLGPLPTSEGSK